jgi:hypothetical protein
MKWFVSGIVALLVGLMASSVVYADKKIDFGDPNFPAPMGPRSWDRPLSATPIN